MKFSYIDATEFKDSLIAWGRESDGTLREEVFPLSDFLYAYTKDNTGNATMKDLWGNPMRKVGFDDKWEFREWCKTRFDLSESDVPPAYKLLLDKFHDAPSDSPYNVLFYDIEVDFDLDDGNGYPTPENPFGEINSFQAFDAAKQCYVMFIPDHLQGKIAMSDKEFPVEVHFTTDERDMLLSIADYIEHVDVLTGWYTKGFDLPYIMERAIKVLGEKEAKLLFCRGGFPAKRRDFVNDFGKDVWDWTLVGRQHSDMMEMYKKFIPGEKTSFSLNAVCEEDLGMTKDDYDGDLGSLYRENPQKFYDYALQDVRLLRLLDKKHQIIRLAMTLARANCVFLSDITGSVKMIETGFIKFCHERGVVLPDKKSSEKEKFPGAIVYDTIAGRHGAVMTVDLTALYPAAMRMLGLSTETYIGQLLNEYDDYVAVMTRKNQVVELKLVESGEVIQILASDLETEIRASGYCLSAAGTLFNGEMGLLSQYVEDRFNTRLAYQKMKKDFYAAGDFEQSDTADLFQKVIKIVCNSLYGCISNAHFRLYDLQLAKSITLTGQVISKWQAYKANDYVNQMSSI